MDKKQIDAILKEREKAEKELREDMIKNKDKYIGKTIIAVNGMRGIIIDIDIKGVKLIPLANPRDSINN
jgi:hypothetical protein